MTLRINAEAPNFTAQTTEGTIDFHDWIGDGWAILFSHPKDFTPVCTTELGYMAGLASAFAERNTKILGLSVDPVGNHREWFKDIEETQGHAVTYPLVGDPELEVAKLYDMLPEGAGDTSEGRTAADNATVRSVFVIGPDKKIKAMLTYPMSTGRNFRRGAAPSGFDPAHGEALGGDAGQLAGRRRLHHPAGDLRRGRQGEIPRRLGRAETLSPHRAAAALARAAIGRGLAGEDHMRRAIALSVAMMRANRGGPFGAVIVKDGKVVAEGFNRVTSDNDPTAHAEVTAIRAACAALDSFSLAGCDIYTSCEPCPMCLAAIYWARIERIFYANTREDAARIGFDDEHIYREIALPPDRRAVPMTRLLAEAAAEAFREWEEKPDKLRY